MPNPAKNTICLWYKPRRRGGREFYANNLSRFVRYRGASRAGATIHRCKKGDVLTVEFTVMGIPCLASTAGRRSNTARRSRFRSRTADQAEDGSLLERHRRQRRPGERLRLVQGQSGA